MCDWANRMEYDKWIQHRDKGRRFGHMTTNIFECVNSMLKGVRNLPICFLGKSTYGRLAELFVHKGRKAEAQLRTGNFSLGAYRVSLRDRTCDCGYFQSLHYPCRHAVACCTYSRLSWATYICPRECFSPLYDGPTVISDPSNRPASEHCPRSTRIHTSMNEVDPTSPKRGGLCRQPGHTRWSCP
nr:uncharacterized protein LOC114925977 [Arachis hypogaea]